MQDVLPPHVEQAMEEAWAARLAQQAITWKATRPVRQAVDHTGVFVIHRPARGRANAAALRPTGKRMG